MKNRTIDDQVNFLREADKLKSVYRATSLSNGERRENSAEHSWHVALYALILADHANTKIDIFRVIKMIIIHDLVEIDVGDYPIFSKYDVAAIREKEAAAATRIFSLLPTDQASEFSKLWIEFDAGETSDAQFAKSMDRFQPPNQNLASGGGTWLKYDVNFEQIESRVGNQIHKGAPRLWAWLQPKIKKFLTLAKTTSSK